MLWRAGLRTTLTVVCLSGLLLVSLPPLGDLSYDLSYLLRPRLSMTNVVIVQANERSLKELGDGANNIHRTNHVALLNRLAADRPKLVFYDFAFVQPGYPKVDAELGQAVKRCSPVVLVTRASTSLEGNAQVVEAMPIIQPLREAAAGIGHAQLSTAEPNREIPEEVRPLDYAPWVAATLLRPELAKEDKFQTRWMNYYGPPERPPFDRCSFHEALTTNVPPGFFRDRVVFVGQGGAGKLLSGKDTFPTPYHRLGSEEADGVILHATALVNLWRGDWLEFASLPYEWGLALGWGCLITLLLHSISHKPLVIPLLTAGVAALLLCVISILVQWQTLKGWAWFGPAFGQTAVALVWVRRFPRSICRQVAFISYRKECDGSTAQLIARSLADRDIPVFIDVRKMEAGEFAPQLLTEIEQSEYFLILLSPNSLQRCKEPGDWVLRELSHALETRRTIIPIFISNFSFKSTAGIPLLPEIDKLRDHHGITFTNEDLDGFTHRLVNLLNGEKPI